MSLTALLWFSVTIWIIISCYELPLLFSAPNKLEHVCLPITSEKVSKLDRSPGIDPYFEILARISLLTSYSQFTSLTLTRQTRSWLQLINKIALAGADSPKSFPDGTDSVVVFEPSNIVSLETKIFKGNWSICLSILLVFWSSFDTMLSNSESVCTICSGGNCHNFLGSIRGMTFMT